MRYRVKKLRESLGYTQQAFAAKLELAPGAVSAWETGRQEVPPSRIQQICETFGARREWLESGEGVMMGPTKKRLTEEDLAIEGILDILRSLPPEKYQFVVKVARRLTQTAGAVTAMKAETAENATSLEDATNAEDSATATATAETA